MRAPAMRPFVETYGMSGTMITAVDLLRGLASLAGWKRREVVGAAAMLGASLHYPLRGAVTWKSIVGTNVAADALSNLSSPGVIGGALEASGAIDHIGNILKNRLSGNLRWAILAFSLVPAFFSALSEQAAGAVSMIVGSEPMLA